MEEYLDNNIKGYLDKIGFCNKKKKKEEETKIICIEAKYNAHKEIDNPILGQI